MSKPAVVSRIPQFSSRIPQIAPSKPNNDVSSKHLGVKVKVNDKEGILRFIGPVSFSKGVWCGVELNSAIGKNDGSVNGVRYFTCAPQCGLMAPLCKVSLAEERCDRLDEDSGPYSMLFLESCSSKNKTADKLNNLGCSETFVHNRVEDKFNSTYDCIDDVDDTDEINQTVILKQDDLNETVVVQNLDIENSLKRKTFNVNDGTFMVDNLKQAGDNQNTFIVNCTFNKDEVECKENFVNRSCENLLHETFAAKRRKINDTITLEQCGDDGIHSSPSSLDYKYSESTPVKNDLKFDLKKVRLSCISTGPLNLDDEKSKRDSLECEESWGILTPDQMVDEYVTQLTLDLENEHDAEQERTSSPKDYSLGLLDESNINNVTSRYSGTSKLWSKLLNSSDTHLKFKLPTENKEPDIQSPNLASVTEYSLGILDEHMLSNLSTAPGTMNLALPLENVTESKNFGLSRLEQTPSPEDLPLDPTPIVIQSDSKEETKSKPPTSFITSITSITSLDTGYQGDGEMSRPASRGADNSPITRRPLPKPQNHRQDPMTDSDFYTESDADNHEESHLRGDRKAQVIDGTLYGVDAQATADIYTNNRENMDSSGIFTDVETNTRAEDLKEIQDISPSDTSTKTISENSQNNVQITPQKIKETPAKETAKKRIASSPVSSITSNLQSPKSLNKNSDSVKKYKMPKRDVASKVKAMIVPNQTPTSEKKTIKKTGRWDSVMNKISKNEQNKSNLKEVKSKVFNVVTPNKTVEQTNKINARQSPNQKTPNSKLRRTRTRNLNTVNSVRNTITLESSINSSLSDVSSAAQQLAKKNNEKKKLITPPNDAKTKKYTITPREKEKKPESPKISENRNNVKPGRQLIVGPSKRNQTNFKEDHRIVEALAILVQHLVFNVEAYSVPTLKREIRGSHLETEEWKKSYNKLEASIQEEKGRHLKALEDKEKLHKEEIENLIKNHEQELVELTKKQQELEESLKHETDNFSKQLKEQHEEQLASLKAQFSKLQANYEERLDILREENEAIREQIDEKKMEVEMFKEEAKKIKKEYEVREFQLKEKVQLINCENQKFVEKTKQLEEEIKFRTEAVREENEKLREENDRLLSYGDEKGIGLQEVQSLRVVLELKQNEVAELRKTLAEVTQRLEVLELAEERANTLNAKCEDLQSQLQRKQEYEQSLINENGKLQESFREENKKNARLVQHNEELQWKLKQNKEIIGHILDQTGDQSFNRSLLNSSLNEKHSATRQQLERSLSFREHSHSNNDSSKSRKYKTAHEFDEDDSPPASPKVKGVVEKSDSVSYVLDLDESPDIVASRIVRRSFRNSTPPKTTPTKSPTNKTPKHSLSLSSSTSSMPGTKTLNKNDPFAEFQFKNSTFNWSSTPKANNGNRCKLDDNSDIDDDNDDDLDLPALPSELNRQSSIQALPTPKHLAGEAMISESASEDESTSSSQL